MAMVQIDYAAHFWGDKHMGYNILYENMKKGEETMHELANFLKERINMEDDVLKCFGKSLNRVNSYIANNGSLVDAWRLMKGTLELWVEIQTTILRNINDMSKDVTRYLDDLVKMRRRTKDVDTLETCNLMQTTTTCLQKAKETYIQRCSEVMHLKTVNKEWNATSTKEYLKARNKLNKAHEEYRHYMEKYSQIRDIFEEKIRKAASTFQEHDRAHLLQLKRFFVQLSKSLEDGHSAQAQVSLDLRQQMENIDIEDIMLRFIEERGTGTELPQKYQWTEADELPTELDVVSCIQSQSSSNSSAILGGFGSSQNKQPSINDLLGLDDNWPMNSFGGGQTLGKCVGDSDSERHNSAEIGTQLQPVATQFSSSTSSAISNMPHQISSWLGRQRLNHWRIRKHSASQSNLPTVTRPAGEKTESSCGQSMAAQGAEFSKSYGDKGTSSFLKRYQKRGLKSSIGDLTQIGSLKSNELPTRLSGAESTQALEKTVLDPLQEFGPPPPLPTTEPPPLDDLQTPMENYDSSIDARRNHSISGKNGSGVEKWSSGSSTSDDDDDETNSAFQTSKIRQLQIRPLSETIPPNSNLNTSVDELRCALGQISLQKSSTFANDPWSTGTGIAPVTSEISAFAQSRGPIRPTLTGDAYLRRKFTDLDSSFDFTQSASMFSSNSNSIARARPRCQTPLKANTTLDSTGSTSTSYLNRAPLSIVSDQSNTPSSSTTLSDPSSFLFPNNTTDTMREKGGHS